VRCGVTLDTSKPIPDVTAEAARLAERGIDLVSVAQIFGYDALTLLALVGQQVPDVELATAVVPIYPRHPVALAAQALTVSAATGGRLTLGIGLSHQIVVENVFGTPFDRPARHMREYLSVLGPLLRHEQVSFQGETLSATTFGPLEIEAPVPPLLVAALGTRMLELAGTLADGTVTWMTGPATVADHIVPTITAAAARAGRPAPRVAVGLPVCVTDDPDGARQRAAELFAIYGTLPSYRAMLDREGAAGPADVAIVGDVDTVRAGVARVAEAGATELTAAIYGSTAERAVTLDLVVDINQEG
jgi:F420-dependent oxidoreductase-like protein